MKARLHQRQALGRLEQAGLEPTAHRLRVLLAVGNRPHPSSAQEIFDAIRTRQDINRVTVYRILDLLVAHGVLNRLGLGEKSQRFCLLDVPGEEHPHFHCTGCDRFLCLDAGTLPLDTHILDALPLDIRHVDIRFEGLCPSCRKTAG